MWCVTIQKDHSYGVILFKSRSISSNLVFACEFGLETQTIVQAMLLLIKKAEWNQVSRILGSREEYFENRSKRLMDSNRSVWTSIYNQCRHSNNSWERGRRDKREKHRKRYFQLPWKERERKRGVLGLELGGAPVHEVYMRILVLNPAPLILFIKRNSLPAAQPGFLLQQEWG